MTVKIFKKDDGTVFGKVRETKDGTYKSFWVVPRGYCSEGQELLIGEYSTKKIAEKNCLEWIKDKWMQQEEAKLELVTEKKKSWFF